MNWLNATGWVYAIDDSHCWPICYPAYLLRGLLPSYINYHVCTLPLLQLIRSWNFTFFRLHNFCGLIRRLAFSFLIQVIVQFLLLSNTLGSVKGITLRKLNYSILCAMRRSFLLASTVLSWFLHSYLIHDSYSNWQVVESIKQGHQALVFVHTRKDTGKTARTLVSLVPFLCEPSPNYSMVVALKCCFPIVCFCDVS